MITTQNTPIFDKWFIRILYIIVMIIILTYFAGCKKHDETVCTQCTESTIGTTVGYCGTEQAVDTYEKELYKNTNGQKWTCVRK